MRINKLSAILIALLIGSVHEAKAADNWLDVTNVFIQNPGFDDNSTAGWTWQSNAGSQTCRAECMEFWNGTFNIWQDLAGLPKGRYRLSVQAYYRMGDNNNSYNSYQQGNEQLTAYLYANSEQATLVSVYTYDFGYWVDGCWWSNDGRIFPNSMESARAAFDNGAYWNVMEFEAEGNVTIGLANSMRRNDNWCIFDNFKLEFQGEAVKVNSIKVNIDKQSLVVGETAQCMATVTPENALQKTVTWSSTKPAVATVDEQGLVQAVGKGTAIIRATSTDGTNRSGSVTVTVTENEAGKESLIINEIMVSNVDQFVSPAFNLDGWMELYNPTDMAASIEGLYLSDDAANLTLWRMPAGMGVIPAHGYKLVWFDSNDVCQLNAPFKLDTDGGAIYISNASGQLLASQTYPAGKERVSYARTTDGGTVWGMTAEATPGASNNGSTFADVQLAAPTVDQPSQLFSGTLSVNVTIPAGTTLRYTIDGSLPTLQNGTTSSRGQFSVSKTACYRFRLFADGMLASPVTTRSYIYKDKDYYLPVVSVVGDDKFLYGAEMGVMVKGSGNGRPGNGQSQPCNWNMNWERPVNFSYMDEQGDMVLNQDVNLEMCGGWSRAWAPHSFKLKGTKEMGGNKHLPYPFFTQKPYIRNRTLQIRNGGNEYGSGRFKDAALGYLLQTSGVYVDVQSYQPIHEFINGKYIGVLNVREPNNKHYAYANYGWDDDEIDLFEMSPDSGYVQKCGTKEAFSELLTLSESAANSETYAELCRQMDMDEYINYMAAEFYLGSTDWPQNNIKAFRLKDGGQWHFVFFDVDFAFNTSNPFNDFMNKEWYQFNELYPTSLGRIYAQIEMVTLFKNLTKNAKFCRKFIDAFCLMGGSVYEASRATDIINMLADRVNPAMQLEGSSVISSANSLKNNLNGRLATATNYLRNYSALGLSSKTAQSVTLNSDIEGARLLINGQQVPTGSFRGNLFAPVTLKAVAPAGYAFKGWIQNTSTTGTTLKAKNSSWSYYDQGSLDGTNWTSPSYTESGWKQGKAPLGYSNKLTMGTTLDYGSDSNNKRPTYYFRTKVNLSKAPTANDAFSMNYYIDDGLVVYVNGTEAGRFNMPSGSISYNTFSSTYADQFPEGTITLPTKLFHQGSNTIAVEVHNNNANSTDIIFDAEIIAQLSSNDSNSYYATTNEIALPSGTVNLTASYRQLTAAERQEQGINPVCINEISGSNNSLINDYFKKADWIELYNTTEQEIDVEGMYLSDNPDKPEKWQISKDGTQVNTKIPAHGYLIVWCDKQPTTSQALHAPFKIDGDGGLLQLMAADKSWKDVVNYDAHDANTTIGRYPDGGADIYAMNLQTIAQPNMLTSYMVKSDPIHTGTQTLIASANGFRMRYGSQQLIVKNEDAETVAIEIFTTDGRMAERTVVDLKGGTGKADVSHLPAGFYVARATDSEGTRVACKFMK